jgi:hypothetical protein
VDWEKVGSSFACPLSEMEGFFQKAKLYAPKIVSLISEHIAALKRASTDTSTFWIDLRRYSAIVLLQDRAQHIGEAVDGRQKSLTTMYSVV